MGKAKVKPILAEVAEKLPDKETTQAERMQSNWAAQMEMLGYDASGMPLAEEQRTNDAGGTKKSAAAGAKAKKKATAKRAKAKKPNEKITPASIFKKMLAFGEKYQIEEEQDFLEAARIYSEEAALIDQMRDRLDEDGLTVMKTYKTGDCEVAHPLLSELPRHVESANKCLMTISSMIEDRGTKKQRAKRDLDAFRLHR
ncbi:MAG: hypothetical protein J6W70_01995 [Lentisphaeria bacterium]|nr:hypothetical protein [Lentisphaeria bacterium]